MAVPFPNLLSKFILKICDIFFRHILNIIWIPLISEIFELGIHCVSLFTLSSSVGFDKSIVFCICHYDSIQNSSTTLKIKPCALLIQLLPFPRSGNHWPVCYLFSFASPDALNGVIWDLAFSGQFLSCNFYVHHCYF